MGKTRAGCHRLYAAVAQMPIASLAAERADNNMALVMERYEKDENALMEMLDAQQGALRTKLATVDGRLNAYHEMAQLIHALGISTSERNATFRDILLQSIQ